MPELEPTGGDRSLEARREALGSLSLDRGDGRPRRRRRLPRWLHWLVVIAVLIGAVVAFQAVTAVIEVQVATVMRASPVADREISTANGYVVARTRASVASKTQGRLQQVLVDEGDVVESGQLLAVVEHDELDASVAEAEAMLEKARRAVPAATAELRRAEAAMHAVEASLAERRAAVVEAEAVLAEREAAFRRTEDLVQREIQSGADLDQAREARDVARARVTLANTSVATVAAQVESSSASVAVERERVAVVQQDIAAAEASLTRVAATRGNAFIRAPFAGMVLRREAEPGEVVSPANTGASGSKTAVVTLADFATLEIEVDVYERDIARISEGTPSRIVLDAYSEKRLRGRVRLLRPTADRARATVQVYVSFDAIPQVARPEMGARVTFFDADVDVLTADELTIPSAAVTMRDDVEGVFLLLGKTVRFQPVEIGAARDIDGESRRIVTAGLSPGDTVVVGPDPELNDGDSVVSDGG